MNGVFMTESMETIDAALPQRERFVPLGGNRYTDYRFGTYQPPEWTESERQQLDEIARVRRHFVKEAMKHAWKGYQTYAWGKDELLPLSKKGHDNWGGMGTTLIDSLRQVELSTLETYFPTVCSNLTLTFSVSIFR